MTTEREALDRIAALKHIYVDSWDAFAYDAEEVRDILAEATPEPGPPDGWFHFGSHLGWNGALEFSTELGEDGLPLWERPVNLSGGDLDRDQAWVVLEPWMQDATELGVQQTLARLAACVRPVAGVVLSPEEIDFVLGWKAYCEISDPSPGFSAAERALAVRLEAAEDA